MMMMGQNDVASSYAAVLPLDYTGTVDRMGRLGLNCGLTVWRVKCYLASRDNTVNCIIDPVAGGRT
jgi:hypothetical protein